MLIVSFKKRFSNSVVQMKFSKCFFIPIVICLVFSCNCIASIIVDFQENDKYFVKLCGTECTFNGIEEFSQGFKNIASGFISYTKVRKSL